jgi:hypothetical protein
MKHKGLFSFAAAVIVVAGFVAQTVLAQTGNGFQVSPVITEETINPGESITTTIRVYNPTQGDITAKIIVNDFEAAVDESGQPRVIFEVDQVAPANSFRKLVGDLGTVFIKAGGEATVDVPISVPEGSSPGGYYGAVRFEPTEVDEGNVSLTASVGSLFLITVPGDLEEGLQLVEFTAAKKGSNGRFFIGGAEDIQISTRLENTGNIHVKPFGKVQITDRKGNVVEQYEFNNSEPRSNVLPDSTRKFVDEIEYGNFFGKYTATANLGYGSTGSLITASTTFWVIPVWLAVVAAGLLVAIIVAAFLIYRKLRQTRKHKVNPRRK